MDRQLTELGAHLPLKAEIERAHNAAHRQSGTLEQLDALCELIQRACAITVLVKLCGWRDASGKGAAELNELTWLQKLSRPSFGVWLDLLRHLEALSWPDSAHPELRDALSLSAPLRRPAQQDATAAILNHWARPGSVQPQQQFSLERWLAAVVELRNQRQHPRQRPVEPGHAALIGPKLHEGVLDLLESTPLLTTWKMIFVEATEYVARGRFSLRAMDLEGRVLPPLETSVDEPLRQQVCLVRPVPTGELLTGLVNLFPFFDFHPATRALSVYAQVERGEPCFSTSGLDGEIQRTALKAYSVLFAPPPDPGRHQAPLAEPGEASGLADYQEAVAEFIADDGRLDDKELVLLERLRRRCGVETADAERIQVELLAARSAKPPAPPAPAGPEESEPTSGDQPPSASTLPPEPTATPAPAVDLAAEAQYWRGTQVHGATGEALVAKLSAPLRSLIESLLSLLPARIWVRKTASRDPRLLLTSDVDGEYKVWLTWVDKQRLWLVFNVDRQDQVGERGFGYQERLQQLVPDLRPELPELPELGNCGNVILPADADAALVSAAALATRWYLVVAPLLSRSARFRPAAGTASYLENLPVEQRELARYLLDQLPDHVRVSPQVNRTYLSLNSPVDLRWKAWLQGQPEGLLLAFDARPGSRTGRGTSYWEVLQTSGCPQALDHWPCAGRAVPALSCRLDLTTTPEQRAAAARYLLWYLLESTVD